MKDREVINEPLPGTVWRHVKTDRRYVILGVATCCTNARDGSERSVIYYNPIKQEMWYREVGEFMDGRFVPLFPQGTF